MPKVHVHTPELLNWLGEGKAQVIEKIEGTELEELFNDANRAFACLAAALSQLQLEDELAHNQAFNNLGDVGNLLRETHEIYRADPLSGSQSNKA